MSAPAAPLLVELVTEELPPKALRKLGDAFASALVEGLRARGFLTGASAATTYATPRRLAVGVDAVLARSPDQPFKQKVLPVAVAFGADGAPTQALAKKLAAMGLDPSNVAAMTRESDGKADALFHAGTKPGEPLATGLQAALDEALAKLPIPKVMSYPSPAGGGGFYNREKFVRPAHRLVALHGADVVPVAALGLAAGRTTLGHRFLGRREIAVESALAWVPTLEAEGKVIPSFDARRRAIEAGLAKQAQGDVPIAPDALLDEVASLVEWPVVYAGTFDPAFLDVPQECLILTMQQNQKYFALTDAGGTMRARFLLVSNLATEDPAAIVAGNERVLRARLADAKFFFDQDRKLRLEDRLPRLRNVVYHQKLGTQAERVGRLRAIARALAPALGADPALADRAALLAKADLVTDMVGEFPELQGTMGMYYAKHDREVPEVWEAVRAHYFPRFAGDSLPQTGVSQAVALADKLDLLVGMFEIKEIPTGDRDPYGLRRAALGVSRTLVEGRVGSSLNVPWAFADAYEVLRADLSRRGTVATQLSPCLVDGQPIQLPSPALAALLFTLERLRGWLRELGYDPRLVASIVDSHPSRWDNILARLDAVRAFESLPEAAALAAANKRIVNILRKSGAEAAAAVDPARLAAGAEADLAQAFGRLEPDVRARFERGDYAGALKALASTKPVVDRYFDEVMVMADDPAVRANRLALLGRVAATMNRVADLSKL